ncbi:MAG: hypothetical protein DMF82_15220 [Acidobacteria bacterium]|nr:MAG: hypothetical protein DMF82_15220 [Acidobacteriota bacterium]
MAKRQSEAELLRLEVEELTEMLRTDDVVEALRTSLRDRGLVIDELLLAGFVEDEDEREWGPIVTKTGTIFLYERSTVHGVTGFINEMHLTSAR